MPEVHLEVLPKRQKALWRELQSHADLLKKFGFYLAGGTGLSLQIGHRQSVDFDFFSPLPDTGEGLHPWLEGFAGLVLRARDRDTVNAEIKKVKVSFIGGYKYPLLRKEVSLGNIKAAGIADIGLMKLLAITHRATLRDYLDLAVILRDHVRLPQLLKLSRKKYGRRFNVMLPLKALVSFQDIENEKPVLFDKRLAGSWKTILIRAVKEMTA